MIELCRPPARDGRVALSRIVTGRPEKYKESFNIPARGGHDSTRKETTSGAEVAVNNIENPKQNCQSHNAMYKI